MNASQVSKPSRKPHSLIGFTRCEIARRSVPVKRLRGRSLIAAPLYVAKCAPSRVHRIGYLQLDACHHDRSKQNFHIFRVESRVVVVRKSVLISTMSGIHCALEFLYPRTFVPSKILNRCSLCVPREPTVSEKYGTSSCEISTLS